jgi:hypothetical protein
VKRPTGWSELLPAGIIAGVGLLFLLPILLFPSFAIVTSLIALGISLVGFVRGCQRAGEQGSFVAFDYLEFLGPLRWIVIIGFFGLYVNVYLLLWLIAQIGVAINRPKRLLPWLGLQVFGFALLFLGFITAAISESVRQTIRGTQAGPVSVAQPNPPRTEVNRPNPDNAKEAAALPRRQAPAATGDRELDQLLTDLGAADGAVRKAAAERLTAMKPNPHRPLVAKTLAEELQLAEQFEREPLIRALGVWATAAEVPLLIQLLDNPDIHTRNMTLDALGKLRDERAVKPVVRCFKEFNTRWHSEQALKALGPLAEKEVLALLEQPERELWVPAIYVLAEIGTEQSLPALREASKTFEMKGVAEGVMMKIQQRMKK